MQILACFLLHAFLLQGIQINGLGPKNIFSTILSEIKLFLLVSSHNPTLKNLHCSLAKFMRTEHSISKTSITFTVLQLLRLFCVVFYSPYLLKSYLPQCSSTFCAPPSLRDNSCIPGCSKYGSGLQINKPKSCTPLPGDALTAKHISAHS